MRGPGRLIALLVLFAVVARMIHGPGERRREHEGRDVWRRLRSHHGDHGWHGWHGDHEHALL
jgi:hypothetical protein